MSVELYMVGHDCKSGLWAGCDGMSGHQFLSANPRGMYALGAFLYSHMHRRLGYELDHAVEDYELRRADQLSDVR